MVRIEGMGCEACEHSVEKALSAVPGVKSVKAYKDKKWTEVFLSDKDIDDRLLLNAMKPLESSYKVVRID